LQLWPEQDSRDEDRAELPVPDDFDAFWAEQKKQIAAVPLERSLLARISRA